MRAIEASSGAIGHEVIVADRRRDGTGARIAASFPQVILVECPPATPLPEMHRRALLRARGAYIAVIEDHCVPDGDWLGNIAAALRAAPEDIAAVGGAVANGLTDRAIDWATFLCEYARVQPPVPQGPAQSLPGMNVAYRRSALERIPQACLASNFWEADVHPRLRALGYGLLSSNAIVVTHKKRFSVRLFVAQRFIYSRHFAGCRFGRQRRFARMAAAVAALLLPFLVLWRISRAALARDQGRELARAAPMLLLFSLVWAAGEIVGYAAGPGDGFGRIE